MNYFLKTSQISEGESADTYAFKPTSEHYEEVRQRMVAAEESLYRIAKDLHIDTEMPTAGAKFTSPRVREAVQCTFRFVEKHLMDANAERVRLREVVQEKNTQITKLIDEVNRLGDELDRLKEGKP